MRQNLTRDEGCVIQGFRARWNMIQGDQGCALISPKRIGLGGPVQLARPAGICMKLVFRCFMVSDYIGERFRHT